MQCREPIIFLFPNRNNNIKLLNQQWFYQELLLVITAQEHTY